VRGEVGERVQVQGPDGVIEFTITAASESDVTLDANYPLAGHTLTIDVTVGQVREAHKDEVRHKRLHHAGHHLMVADSSRLED
jgi:FKBP-type peptidyl-prolyl cis-trans isomerase SlyD